MRNVLIFLIFQVVGLRFKTVRKMPKGNRKCQGKDAEPGSFCGGVRKFKPSVVLWPQANVAVLLGFLLPSALN